MANWANPTITSNYITFVDEVKARDVDAITLQAIAVTNPPVSSIRLLRAPTKFQEWNGSIWVDKILSPEGGGTGSNSLAGITGALGLGSMAYQNSPNVNITGGGLTNVTIANTTINVANSIGGMTFSHTGAGIPIDVSASAGNWGVIVRGPTLGLYTIAGNSKSDFAFLVQNAAQNRNGLIVRGDQSTLIQNGLTIPVGPNKYVPV
jgi:hypothetical protein